VQVANNGVGADDVSLTGATRFERDQNDFNPLVVFYLVQADLTLILRHAPVVLSVAKTRISNDRGLETQRARATYIAQTRCLRL
jgi:hypothetical protein